LQKFRANFFRFGGISSISQPKNLLIWGNFTQIERNLLEIFGAKLNCADAPISAEKNNYCVQMGKNRLFQESFQNNPPEVTLILYMEYNRHYVEKLCAKGEK
jgi:hypothetical protein